MKHGRDGWRCRAYSLHSMGEGSNPGATQAAFSTHAAGHRRGGVGMHGWGTDVNIKAMPLAHASHAVYVLLAHVAFGCLVPFIASARQQAVLNHDVLDIDPATPLPVRVRERRPFLALHALPLNGSAYILQPSFMQACHGCPPQCQGF